MTMIIRKIVFFDKISEEYQGSVELKINDLDLFSHYKQYIKEDPNLFLEYPIHENEEHFFHHYVSLKFDFNRYDYFLSCSELGV